MTRHLATLAVSLLACVGTVSGPANADGGSNRFIVDRHVDRFAALPEGVRFPEGITANPANGDIYVGTFDGGAQNKLLRYDRHGHLVGQRDFGVAPLLGLEFDRANNRVYVTVVGDFVGAASRIQRVAADLNSGAIEDVATIPGIGAPLPRTAGNPDGSSDTITFGSGARVPNAMTFDSHENLYVSDSFQGAIFKITNPQACAPSCIVQEVSHDPLLATAGFPPFGANGIAFNKEESALFVANTGDDRVLRLDMATLEVSVFAESINGADGIAFDKQGLLWVAANQADEVVALDVNGKVVAKLGEFRGVKRDGTPDGLLFPASLAIFGNEIFVTNLALPLNTVPGDEVEEDVSRWTISSMKLLRRRD
jgi:DNA-binding beta-propeller fold protein YncE